MQEPGNTSVVKCKPRLSNLQEQSMRLIIYLLHWSLLVDIFGYQLNNHALENKHLRVVAEPWKPFFIMYCPDGQEKVLNTPCASSGDHAYGGALWDMLMFMKHGRNLTLTMLRAPDKAWGVCYGRNNCTGMIGMVNRGEADLAIGEISSKLVLLWSMSGF